VLNKLTDYADRQLFRGLGADVQPHRRDDPPHLFVGAAFGMQCFQESGTLAPAPHQADETGRRFQTAPNRSEIMNMPRRGDDHAGIPGNPGLGKRLRHRAAEDLVGKGAAFP
jgi:hypothetical protein